MEQNMRDGKMLTMCGLDCAACPASIANVPPAKANLEEVRRARPM